MTKIIAPLAVAAVLAVGGCGSATQAQRGSDDANKQANEKVSTFNVLGVIEVEAISNGKVGSDCRPDAGVPRPGAEPSGVKVGDDVTVTDASGKIVGLGKVEPGHYMDSGYSISSYCEVPFSVSDVPDGDTFYSVQVGDLSPEQYTRDELYGLVRMTL